MPDNASTAVATRDTSPVGQFQRQLETRARDIQMALPGHITSDKFQRTVLTAVAQNDDLLKADRNSLILAIYKAAQDGLLPDGREAAFVTFNTRFKDQADGQWKSRKLCQYMPMVYGLRKKILQSAEVVSLEVNVVYRSEVEKGTFLYEVGIEPPLRHRPSLDLTEEETADDQIVGAYSIATMKDGTKSYEIMRRFEIDKVRQVSQTGATVRTDRQGKAIEPKGPWVDWFAEMAKKTVMRRHSKTLPMSGDVLIDVEGREFERGASAALALGGETPDEPTLITDDTPHDPETGEVIEADANANTTGDDTNATAEETQTETVKETAKAEPKPKARSRGQASAEGNAPASEATAQSSAAAGSTASGETTSSNGPTATTTASPSEADTATDEAGVTEHPASKKADQILEKFSTAETIIDLEKLYAAHEEDISAMPDEIYDGVMGGYNRNRVRLGAARVRTPATEPAE